MNTLLRLVVWFGFTISSAWAQITVEASSEPDGATSAPLVDCAGALDDIVAVLLLDREETDSSRLLDAYLCLHSRSDAGPVLMEHLERDPEDAVRNRLSRSLTIWLLGQLERELTGSEIRALNADDRRLLREGIAVRRGFEPACITAGVPASECTQARIFPLFDWYQPRSNYNPGMLTELDIRNRDLIDDPPEAPAPAPESVDVAMDVADAMEPEPATCGCGTVRRTGFSYVGGLLLLAFAYRRR